MFLSFFISPWLSRRSPQPWVLRFDCRRIVRSFPEDNFAVLHPLDDRQGFHFIALFPKLVAAALEALFDLRTAARDFAPAWSTMEINPFKALPLARKSSAMSTLSSLFRYSRLTAMVYVVLWVKE